MSSLFHCHRYVCLINNTVDGQNIIIYMIAFSINFLDIQLNCIFRARLVLSWPWIDTFTV